MKIEALKESFSSVTMALIEIAEAAEKIVALQNENDNTTFAESEKLFIRLKQALARLEAL